MARTETERRLEQLLVSLVTKAGGMAPKFVSPGLSGVPDRIVILDGQVVFVEMKKPTGRLSAIQKRIIARMERAGARVEILASEDEVRAFVRSLKTTHTSTNHLQ